MCLEAKIKDIKAGGSGNVGVAAYIGHVFQKDYYL